MFIMLDSSSKHLSMIHQTFSSTQIGLGIVLLKELLFLKI